MGRSLKYLRLVMECIAEDKKEAKKVAEATEIADAAEDGVEPEDLASDELLVAMKSMGAKPRRRTTESSSGDVGWSYNASDSSVIWLFHRNGTEIELLDCSNGWFRVRGPKGQTNVVFPAGAVEKQDIARGNRSQVQPLRQTTSLKNGGFKIQGDSIKSNQNGADVTLSRDGSINIKGKLLRFKQ